MFIPRGVTKVGTKRTDLGDPVLHTMTIKCSGITFLLGTVVIKYLLNVSLIKMCRTHLRPLACSFLKYFG